MRKNDRISQIQAILQQKRNASTKYLCSVLNASESTVRRDVDFLIAMNPKVRRVYGGVVLADSRDDLEYMFELKLNQNLNLKHRIAAVAATLVEEGDSMVLDSGTTCLFVSKQMHLVQNLRIVTTDVKIAEEIAKCENIESIVIGGVVRPGYYAIGDTLATETLDHFAVDKVIMSADAIHFERGVTNFSSFEVGVKKKIITMANRVILVADHTKFGKVSFYKIADLSAFSTIVTTKELDPEYVDRIRETGVELILA